jgi:hypothetical protein
MLELTLMGRSLRIVRPFIGISVHGQPCEKRFSKQTGHTARADTYQVLRAGHAEAHSFLERQGQAGREVLLVREEAGITVELEALRQKLAKVHVVKAQHLLSRQAAVDNLQVQVIEHDGDGQASVYALLLGVHDGVVAQQRGALDGPGLEVDAARVRPAARASRCKPVFPDKARQKART